MSGDVRLRCVDDARITICTCTYPLPNLPSPPTLTNPHLPTPFPQMSVLTRCLSETIHMGPHVTDRVLEFIEGVCDSQMAEQIKAAVGSQRQSVTDTLTMMVYERPFSLCEH